MRKNFTSSQVLRLLKAATILSIGGITAGCSSDVIRFNDGFYTGAVPKQAVAAAPDSYGQPNYNPGVDPSMTGSIQPGQVGRAALPRPSDSQVGAPQPSGSVGMAAPTYPPQATNRYPAAPANVSPMSTASVTTASAPAAPAQPTAGRYGAQAASVETNSTGWSKSGGTQVTIREGETIYNLSRRYGVPAKSIMEANGIADATAVRAGQRISIPTYSYSQSVGVSAPDSNPAVAKASATVGAPQKLTAVPSARPATQTAALQKPEAPARSAAISNGGRYTVVSGDTLYGISLKTGASVDAIKRVNKMSGDTVRLGQKLIIPGLTDEKVTTASAKPLDPIRTSSVQTAPAKKPEVKEYTPPKQAAETGAIRKIEAEVTAKAPDSTGVNAMRWPVQGRVVSAFGSNDGGRPNDGIDISVPQGTPVKAAENGVVIYAGDGLKELGKTILVRHADGLVTVYGHVSKIDVKRGDDIKRGQQIASSGMSGAAKQPQLHFEVRKNSKPVNPASYLQ